MNTRQEVSLMIGALWWFGRKPRRPARVVQEVIIKEVPVKAAENQKKPTNDQDTAFEKARSDYAAKQYDHETTRQSNLEGKAQFYLAFVTTYLGAIFLTLPFLQTIERWLGSGVTNWVWKVLLLGSIAVLGLALFFSLFAIYSAMALRRTGKPYPKELYLAIFDPGDYTLIEKANEGKKSEAGLSKGAAQYYAAAAENRSRVNDARADRVRLAAMGIVVSIIALAVLLGVVAILQLFPPFTSPTEPLQVILITPTPIPAAPTH